MKGFRCSVFSLRWWSSQLARDNRAEHGASAIEPIEITVEAGRSGRGMVEVVVGAATIRCEPGMDVGYIAALVRAIAGP
jgi:adenosine/AMP kinase